MEFNELQKVWDEQNKRTMYAINEEVLYQEIKRRRQAVDHHSSVLEFGYILISVIASVILLFTGSGRIFSYVTIAMLLGVAVFIYVQRLRRRREQHFDRSIHGELQETLRNLRYQERAFTYIAWWYILPLAIPSTLNMATATDPVPLWKWIFVFGSFILGFLVIRSSVTYGLRPKIRRVEELQERLMEME